MTANLLMEDLRQLLMRMTQEQLVDAVVNYAASDEELMRHLNLIARVASSNSQEMFLHGIMLDIESTFGNKNLAEESDRWNAVRFAQVADLISELLRYGMFDSVIQASERCFELVENVAEVQEPDDFLDQCYLPIIRMWLLALHGANVHPAAIAQQVSYLEATDEYGVFFNIAGDFHEELGPIVLHEMRALKEQKKTV